MIGPGKTGTLTEDRLTVPALWTSSDRIRMSAVAFSVVAPSELYEQLR